MDWVKDHLKELKLASDNAARPAFASQSPVNLNKLGEEFLSESGMRKYIEDNKDFLLSECKKMGNENPYQVQENAFKVMDEYKFDDAFYAKLLKFAFDKGTTPAVLRRVAGIHLRNVCLDSLGMDRDDIDKHTPTSV